MSNETKITSNYFLCNGLKYFRDNAPLVELGSYGQKKGGSLTGNAYLAVEATVSRANLEDNVKHVTNVSIDWSRATKADVETHGALKYFGLNFKAANSISFEQAKSAKLQLCEFAILEGNLKKMLNNGATAARSFMAGEGKDARIASVAFIVVSGELAQHFKVSTKFHAAASKGSNALEIVASGGTSGSQTIELARGCTFAYGLHKVKDWNRGKTEILDMEDELFGTG